MGLIGSVNREENEIKKLNRGLYGHYRVKVGK